MHGSSHSSPVLIKKARLEIIPLIDIMFFLLASFMLVSLTMINMKAIDVALPTATSAQPNTKPDFIIVSIDALMDIYFEKEKVPREEVLTKFQDLYSKNHDVRIYLRADQRRELRHGNVCVGFSTHRRYPEGRARSQTERRRWKWSSNYRWRSASANE